MPDMQMSDVIALIALAVAASAMALEVRRWFESGAHLHLAVMPDVLIVPGDDGKPKANLIVTNRGNAPTVLTTMVVYTYRSKWDRSIGKVGQHALVPNPSGNPSNPGLPFELGVNQRWTGLLYYRDPLIAARENGCLYIGVMNRAGFSGGCFV